jgi:hypothetical protein
LNFTALLNVNAQHGPTTSTFAILPPEVEKAILCRQRSAQFCAHENTAQNKAVFMQSISLSNKNLPIFSLASACPGCGQPASSSPQAVTVNASSQSTTSILEGSQDARRFCIRTLPSSSPIETLRRSAPRTTAHHNHEARALLHPHTTIVVTNQDSEKECPTDHCSPQP